MEAINHPTSDYPDTLLAPLRHRIDTAAEVSGTVYAANELHDLLCAAADHADGQTVPATLLIRAMRIALASYTLRIVPLDNEIASTLVDLASDPELPVIPRQLPGTELELMA